MTRVIEEWIDSLPDPREDERDRLLKKLEAIALKKGMSLDSLIETLD